MLTLVSLLVVSSLISYAVICYGYSKHTDHKPTTFAVEQFVNQFPDAVRTPLRNRSLTPDELRELGTHNGFIYELDWRGTFALLDLITFVQQQYEVILPYEKTHQFIEANSTSPGTSGNYTINLLRSFDQDLALGGLRLLIWDSTNSNYFISVLPIDNCCEWVKKHPELFQTVHQLKL